MLSLEKQAETYLLLPENNCQMPVYGSRMGVAEDERQGYSFVEITDFNLGFSGGAFAFQPLFEGSACEHLKAGADTSRVQVVVQVSWRNGKGAQRWQNFAYTDEMVRNYMDSHKPESGKYGQMFTLKLQVESLKPYSFRVMVVSDTGVTITSNLFGEGVN